MGRVRCYARLPLERRMFVPEMESSAERSPGDVILVRWRLGACSVFFHGRRPESSGFHENSLLLQPRSSSADQGGGHRLAPGISSRLLETCRGKLEITPWLSAVLSWLKAPIQPLTESPVNGLFGSHAPGCHPERRRMTLISAHGMGTKSSVRASGAVSDRERLPCTLYLFAFEMFSGRSSGLT